MRLDTLMKDDIEILFSGQWSEDDLTLFEGPSSRCIDNCLESASKEAWQTMLAEANASGRQLWDSETYRLEDVRTEHSALSLALSTMPFSVRLGMNRHTEQVKRLGITYAPKALYTSCLVSTTDGYYVFIEKSDKYFTSKKYAWVGGVLSKSEGEIKSGKDLFNVVGAEVLEELGVAEANVASVKLLSGYLSENWNVCLLFAVDLAITTVQLQDLFAKQSDGEAARLLFIGKNDLQEGIDIFEPKDQTKFAVLNLV